MQETVVKKWSQQDNVPATVLLRQQYIGAAGEDNNTHSEDI